MSQDLKFLQINPPKLEASSQNQKEKDSEQIQAVSDDYEDCKTPTSSEHKIPTIQSCPPTPKKKVQISFHKRKLAPEILFFEALGREEVDSFFRSSSDLFLRVESPGAKKRCKSL